MRSTAPRFDRAGGALAFDVFVPFALLDGDVFGSGHFDELPRVANGQRRHALQPAFEALGGGDIPRLQPRLEGQEVAHRIAFDNAAKPADPLRLAVAAA